MGVAVSASLHDLSVRRRSSNGSRGSRGSRTSLLRNPILELPAQRPSSPPDQRRLSDPPPTKPETVTAATTTARKDSNPECATQIIRERRANSNTVNSIHLAPPHTDRDMSPFDDPPVACMADAPPAPTATTNNIDNIWTDIHVHRNNDTPESAKETSAKEAGRPAHIVEVDKSVAHSAPPTAMRYASPKLPVARSLRWADVPYADDAPSAIFASPPPTTPPAAVNSEFNPWGLRHSASLSCPDGSDLSKAVIATSNFKASYQRLCEEPRSRGNSISVNKSARTDSVGARVSREERRTNSTQLSTEEWSHLLELMDTNNGLICVDDDVHHSRERPSVDSLPAYPATDTTTVVEDQHPQRLNTSLMTEHVDFSPLRMRFSSTTSFLSGLPSTEMDLQRAISSVDSYAANLRRLLTSWQDILDHHFEAFVSDLSSVLTSKHPTFGSVPQVSSADEHARMMLQMVGQAVLLVSQMEDMFSVLLEMGAMHRRNDIGAGHFEALHLAFMEVLPHHIPADQRELLCEAVWEPFWQIVVKLLSQGSKTERGEWYAAQRRAEWMAETRAVLGAVAEQQQQPAFRGTFLPHMLDRAEAVNPAMSQFALLRESRAAIRSFEGIVFVALELDDAAARVRYIEQLAHEHIVFGLSEWGLRELRQPFIDTCRHYTERSAKPQAWMTTTTAASLGLFWDMLTTHWVEGIAASRRSLADIRSLSAPSGSRPFCMMFTDVEAGSRLWELQPSMMADAMTAHNRLLRRLIAEHGAYEVKTDGDAFAIAAKDVCTALQIAVALQLELMRGPIAEDFSMVPVVQGGGLRSCWRADSLRVRVGIHYCTDASAVYDSVQRRFDYYGPSVNCAARTVAAAAGGQILLTQDAVRALRNTASTSEDSPMPIAEIAPGSNPMDAVLDSLLEFQWWGEQRFRGMSEPVGLYSVLPMRLAGRTFPYFVGNRKVRVSAPSDMDGRRTVCRLSLAQLRSGNIDESAMALLRPR